MDILDETRSSNILSVDEEDCNSKQLQNGVNNIFLTYFPSFQWVLGIS